MYILACRSEACRLCLHLRITKSGTAQTYEDENVGYLIEI